MLDALFDQAFRVIRQNGATVKNEISYSEILGAGGEPLPVPCRVERRRRRVYRKDNTALEVDATLICRRTSEDFPELKAEDVVVLEDTQEAYRVATIDEDAQAFSSDKYLKLSLVKTQLPTPKEKADA